MKHLHWKSGLAGVTLLGGLVFLPACASKSYVNGQVSEGNAQTEKHINQVESQVEQNQSTLSEHGQKLQQLDQATRDALARAQEAGKLAEGKFNYSIVLSDDACHFPVNGHQLSKEAIAKLDQFVEKLKSDNKSVYLEIQGHTDSTGSAAYNMRLGQERADAVRLYLNQKGVALNRMNTISYGRTQPAVSNKTRAGRSKNRRVVIVVLS